jgi:hypothetical protein
MKKFLVVLSLLGAIFTAQAEIVTVPIPGAPGLSVTVGTGVNALPLQNIQNNPNAVNITQGDDSWTNVPLGFDFPMYGQRFNNSWAMTNGMVTFKDPTVSGIYGACCSGIDLRNTTDTRWNYSIFGVHSDLYSSGTNNQYYLRGNNSMTYGWYNVSQCCDSAGGNSFEIKINSSGVIDTRIAGAMVQWNTVTSGFSGDLSKGEYYQYYHGQGWNISGTGAVSWGALGGTGSGAVDICLTNPLSSPSCPNYFTAQCTVSALYNPSCPGYAAAYFTQQCTANPLYDVNCPGYAAAYLDYQCSINPLYSTTCQGYEQAYFNEQCRISPLYSQSCSGYRSAYHDQQCSLDPLYATDCIGYSNAYHQQQCTANPLYSTTCVGYDQAYLAQQCSLNGLYSKSCPNYATAYATKALLEQQGTASTVATAGVIAATAPVTSTPTTDSSGEVKVAVVADKNVNDVITNTATSASPAQAATATVPLAAPPAAPAPEPAPKKAEAAPAPMQMTQAGPSGDKPAQPTARQALAERRAEAAKKDAVEKGKNLANEMGKAADMESQKQVQNVVIQAMGFTPGFDTYNKAMLPDTVGYKPFTVYNNQKNIDNRANLRMWTGTDRLHNELVDSQYKEK